MKHMTLNEFYAKLDAIKDKVDWFTLENGQIRGMIESGTGFCPLTAVAYFHNEIYFQTHLGFACGVELGMDTGNISSIVMAADNPYTKYVNVRDRLEEMLLGEVGEPA